MKAHIVSVRELLLALHKALMDLQRAEHERIHNKRLTPGELLQLLTGDAAFDWLHPFSQLIVAIDELEEREVPPTEKDAAAVRLEVERVLTGELYEESIERDPNVAVAHGRILAALARLPAPAPDDHESLLALRPSWRGPRKTRRPGKKPTN